MRSSNPSAPQPSTPHPPSHIITTAALYHLTGCITTSFLPYRDYSPVPPYPSYPFRASPATTARAVPTRELTSAPIGYTAFPHDMQVMPRKWMESQVGEVRVWGMPERGGHFGAKENAGAWVEGVREMMKGELF